VMYDEIMNAIERRSQWEKFIKLEYS
jgi:hypothetical protein